MKFRIVKYENNSFVIQRRILGLFWIKYKRPSFEFRKNCVWIRVGKSCYTHTTLSEAYDMLKNLKDTMTPFKYRGHKILGGPYTFVDVSTSHYDVKYDDDVYDIGATSIFLIKQMIDEAEDEKIANKTKKIKSKHIVKIYPDIYEKDAL